MILGILGVYLGKLFIQSKQRPQFIIDEMSTPGSAAGSERERYQQLSELMVVGA